MGAIYLKPLDEAMEKTGLFYARFMDDWVVLAPTRWKLRNVARIINQVLNQLKVWQHPEKTFVGRVAKGFDFLGYHLTPSGLSVANKTRQRFVSRVTRLDQQGSISEVIEGYVRRWRRWVTSGLGVWATQLRVFDDALSEPSRTGLEIARRRRRRRKRVKGRKGKGLFPHPPSSITQTAYTNRTPHHKRTGLWHRGGR